MWKCSVCGYEYDEAKEGKKFEELPMTGDVLCAMHPKRHLRK